MLSRSILFFVFLGVLGVYGKIDPQYQTTTCSTGSGYYYVPDNPMIITNSTGHLYLTVFVTSTYYNSYVAVYPLSNFGTSNTRQLNYCASVGSFITSWTDSSGFEWVIIGCVTQNQYTTLYKLNPITTGVVSSNLPFRGGLVPQFFPVVGKMLYLAEPASFPSQNLSITIYSVDLSQSSPVNTKIASALLPWARGSTGNNVTGATITPDRLVLSYRTSQSYGIFVYSWPPSSNPTLKELPNNEEDIFDEKSPFTSYLVLLRTLNLNGPTTPFVVAGTGDVGLLLINEQKGVNDILLTTVEYDLNYYNGPAVSLFASHPSNSKIYNSVFGGGPIVNGCAYFAWLNATNGFIVNEIGVPYNRYTPTTIYDTYQSELTSMLGFAQKGNSMVIWNGATLYLFDTTC